MARDGNINMVLGMWISSMILAPAGAYLTFMANRDAVVFNRDVVMERFRKFFALRIKRHVFRKEVILTPPDWDADRRLAVAVRRDLEAYPGKKTPLVAAELFHAFLPTSAGRNRKTLGQQRRSACGRSQQQHLAADSFGVGRHARAV